MEDRSNITFQHPDLFYITNIVDDGDVCHMVGVIESVQNVVHLYVVEGVGDIHCSGKGKPSNENKSSGLRSNNVTVNEPILYLDPTNFNYVSEENVVGYEILHQPTVHPVVEYGSMVDFATTLETNTHTYDLNEPQINPLLQDGNLVAYWEAANVGLGVSDKERVESDDG
ncbi:hypothetical protein L2E82_31583 [Cichorium intybus]|uniref:Uncharacterized protein n=1 Tax=Cichorium intybus TaxID=13427 RepID=A0ACB9BF84_CICIN|nr:hypothetical protein L2E82_31583 [Cichorium intybus]